MDFETFGSDHTIGHRSQAGGAPGLDSREKLRWRMDERRTREGLVERGREREREREGGREGGEDVALGSFLAFGGEKSQTCCFGFRGPFRQEISVLFPFHFPA